MTESTVGYSSLEPLTFYAAYIGMILILAAFVLETRGVVNSRGKNYLIMMAIGSSILGIRAFHTGEWAFVVLEVVWACAALLAIFSPSAPVSDSSAA
ncbi:MAG: hypothetical protein HOE69_03930 [Euryarchaeota archaeon]|jgi:hypothetical protein|nr:hypothetical protein [Euryarchaeota archaeon]